MKKVQEGRVVDMTPNDVYNENLKALMKLGQQADAAVVAGVPLKGLDDSIRIRSEVNKDHGHRISEVRNHNVSERIRLDKVKLAMKLNGKYLSILGLPARTKKKLKKATAAEA